MVYRPPNLVSKHMIRLQSLNMRRQPFALPSGGVVENSAYLSTMW